jgi:hypothetical protein
MGFNDDVICTKRITVNIGDLDAIEPPKLSEGARQAIAESGVEALQAFLRPNFQRALGDVIRAYWGINSRSAK